jgi:hypothetical protein
MSWVVEHDGWARRCESGYLEGTTRCHGWAGSWKPDAVERGGLGEQSLGEEGLGTSGCAGEPRKDGEGVGSLCLTELPRVAWIPSQ